MTLSELSNILINALSGAELQLSSSCEPAVVASVTLPSMGTFIMEHTPSQIVNDGNLITPPSLRVVFDSSLVAHNESIDIILSDYRKIKRVSVESAEDELLTLIKEIKLKLLDATFVEFPGFGIIRFSEESHFVFEPDPHFDPAGEYYGLEPLPLRVINDCRHEDQEKAVGNESDSGIMQDSEEGASGSELKTSTVKRGFPLAFSIVLAVVLLFVILVLVVVLFKDELMPLLERLLYSKEELQFLRENGM